MRRASRLWGELPLTNLPPQDRIAWSEAVRSDDPFARGPAAHWSDGTRATVFHGYRQWLGWLACRHPQTLALAPHDRVTIERVRAYLDELAATISPAGLSNSLHHLHLAIRAIAPDTDWAWLRGMVRKFERQVAAKHQRPSTFDPRIAERLGYKLMASARLSSGLAAARDYRDGLLLALLSRRPLRRRNIAAIRIGINLVRAGASFDLRFAPDETKTRQPIQTPVPGKLLGPLEHYLQRVRPAFPRADTHDALWPSTRGKPLVAEQIYVSVRRRLSAVLKRPVSLHAFRHAVASHIAEDRPGHVDLARDLLGHADLQTTHARYIATRTTAAGQTFAKVLDAERQRLKRKGDRS